MATTWMISFDWDGFQTILNQPTEELASTFERRRIAQSIPYSTSVCDLPRSETEMAEYLRDLFASADWYAQKSERESRAIDGLLDYLFDQASPLEPLKLEPLSDGVSLEILEIANGRAEVDQTRMTAKSRQILINRIVPGEEDESSELANLGSRPFRHGSWSRKGLVESLKLHNPFLGGGESVYVPDYSIHSPDQVELLRRDLLRVAERVRRNVELLKSRALREQVLASFQDNLVGPIEKASAERVAIFAGQDY